MELRKDKKAQRHGSVALGLSGLFCEQPFPLQPRLYPIFFNRPLRELSGDRSADALHIPREPGANESRVPSGIFRNGANAHVHPKWARPHWWRWWTFIFASNYA